MALSLAVVQTDAVSFVAFVIVCVAGVVRAETPSK